MQGLNHLSSLKQVVLDCANGAMSLIAPRVWEATGVSLICLNQQAPEKKINHECGSLYPETLKQAVLESKSCLGIAFDGDGDRLLMVDRHGEVLNGEDLLWLLMPKSQEISQPGIVLTELVNQGFKQYVDKKQYRVRVTPVGDEHVIQAMKSSSAILGGEPNGHLIVFPWMMSSDALINSLLVAIAMNKSGQILAGYQRPWVPTVSQSLSFPLEGVEQPEALKSALIQELSKYSDLWSLVRFSGTEPLIRVSLQAAPDKLAGLKFASIQAEKIFKSITTQPVELS
jgi:phosphoglucosamine mutase